MSDKTEWFPASVEPDENKPIWIETTRKELHPYRHARLVKWNYVERWCYATPPPLPEPDPEFQEGELVWATFLEEVSTGWTKQKVIRLCLYSRRLQKSCTFCRRPTDAELQEMGLMRIKEDE